MKIIQNIKKGIGFLKRFFEPAIKNKIVTSKMFLEGSITTLWFDVLPLFFIPYLVKLVDQKNILEIYYLMFFVFIIYLILWIIGYKIRHWVFEAKYVFEAEIEKLYRAKTILNDGFAMDKIGTGKVQSIIQKGIIKWSDGMWQMIYQVPRIIFGIGSGLYVTLNFGYLYLALFIIFIFISTTFYYIFRKKELFFQENINKLDDEMTSQSVKMIMSRQEIVFADTTKKEIDKLLEINKKQKDLQKVGQKYDFMADLSISGTIIVLPFLGVLVAILNKDIYSLSGVLIIPFIYFASRFSFLMWQLVWAVRQFLDIWPQVKNFWKFVDETPSIKNYHEGKEFIHGNGEIEMQNINFSYNEIIKKESDESEKDKKEENRVLKNFNLKIKGGTKVALVGKSGSGKTTIAKLISGYLKIEPVVPSSEGEGLEMKLNSGKVLIDNQDITELSLKSYYKYIGYLTQEPMVFDGSIRENLLYAVNDEISEEKIKEALEKAKCDFVFKAEKGLETQIGEKGIRLSGGERQRLAIAKLFLKDPEIIILDEPTSALDSFSEDKISKSLEELFKGRTVIIIAHRLQTVKKADRILVIEDGEIKEDGKHDELIKLNGAYSKMLEMQSGF